MDFILCIGADFSGIDKPPKSEWNYWVREGMIPLMDAWTDKRDFILRHGSLLLRSYRRWTGSNLIEPCGDETFDAKNLFEADFVVVSAGADTEQLLKYANSTALRLWEMDWATLTSTPSRQTAEPMHRDERAGFLRRVREKGFIDDYSGIRISTSGRRFRIQKATVWNLVDESDLYIGQAATFSNWEFIE